MHAHVLYNGPIRNEHEEVEVPRTVPPNFDMAFSYYYFSHTQQLTYRKDHITGPASAKEVFRTHTESVMSLMEPSWLHYQGSGLKPDLKQLNCVTKYFPSVLRVFRDSLVNFRSPLELRDVKILAVLGVC